MDGTWTDEYKYRLHKDTVLGDTIGSSSISHHQAYMIHSVQYKLAIKYALQHTRFAPRQCDDLQKPVVNAILPKMGFNRKMPRAVVYGPRALGGMEFIHLETEQFALQLRYFRKMPYPSRIAKQRVPPPHCSITAFLGTHETILSSASGHNLLKASKQQNDLPLDRNVET